VGDEGEGNVNKGVYYFHDRDGFELKEVPEDCKCMMEYLVLSQDEKKI